MMKSLWLILIVLAWYWDMHERLCEAKLLTRYDDLAKHIIRLISDSKGEGTSSKRDPLTEILPAIEDTPPGPLKELLKIQRTLQDSSFTGRVTLEPSQVPQILELLEVSQVEIKGKEYPAAELALKILTQLYDRGVLGDEETKDLIEKGLTLVVKPLDGRLNAVELYLAMAATVKDKSILDELPLDSLVEGWCTAAKMSPASERAQSMRRLRQLSEANYDDLIKENCDAELFVDSLTAVSASEEQVRNSVIVINHVLVDGSVHVKADLLLKALSKSPIHAAAKGVLYSLLEALTSQILTEEEMREIVTSLLRSSAIDEQAGRLLLNLSGRPEWRQMMNQAHALTRLGKELKDGSLSGAANLLRTTDYLMEGLEDANDIPEELIQGYIRIVKEDPEGTVTLRSASSCTLQTFALLMLVNIIRNYPNLGSTLVKHGLAQPLDKLLHESKDDSEMSDLALGLMIGMMRDSPPLEFINNQLTIGALCHFVGTANEVGSVLHYAMANLAAIIAHQPELASDYCQRDVIEMAYEISTYHNATATGAHALVILRHYIKGSPFGSPSTEFLSKVIRDSLSDKPPEAPRTKEELDDPLLQATLLLAAVGSKHQDKILELHEEALKLGILLAKSTVNSYVVAAANLLRTLFYPLGTSGKRKRMLTMKKSPLEHNQELRSTLIEAGVVKHLIGVSTRLHKTVGAKNSAVAKPLNRAIVKLFKVMLDEPVESQGASYNSIVAWLQEWGLLLDDDQEIRSSSVHILRSLALKRDQGTSLFANCLSSHKVATTLGELLKAHQDVPLKETPLILDILQELQHGETEPRLRTSPREALVAIAVSDKEELRESRLRALRILQELVEASDRSELVELLVDMGLGQKLNKVIEKGSDDEVYQSRVRVLEYTLFSQAINDDKLLEPLVNDRTMDTLCDHLQKGVWLDISLKILASVLRIGQQLDGSNRFVHYVKGDTACGRHLVRELALRYPKAEEITKTYGI